MSANEDYYKPKLTKSGYDGNYTQYESKGDRILSIQEYLALIEKYLRKLINQYKNEGEWKIQLIAKINFISLKPGSDETRVMYTRSDNEEFMSGVTPMKSLNYFLDHSYKNTKKIYKIR